MWHEVAAGIPMKTSADGGTPWQRGLTAVRSPHRRGGVWLPLVALAMACIGQATLALVEAPGTVWPTVAAEGAAMVVADFTGDGQPEILCGRRGGLRLLRRSASGLFAEIPDALSGPADGLVALLAADLDNDGDLDILQLDAHGPGRWLRNPGTGVFPSSAEQELPLDADGNAAAAAADLDGDGDVDLLVGRRGSPPLWLRNDNGVFRAVALGLTLARPAVAQVAVATLNADPWPDALLFDRDAGIIILLNQGTGTFALSTAPRPVPPAGLRGGALADVDGDGDADLLGAGRTGAFLWLNQGDGAFVAAPSFPTLDAAILTILPCDLDVDGDLDLFLACSGQDHVLLNDGRGGFADTPALLPVHDGRSFAAASGDVNGDLAPDVVVAVPDGPDRLLLGAFAAPVIRLEAPAQAVVGRAFSVRVAAADPDGVQSLVLTANGVPLAIAGGQATFTATATGPVDFVATASDTLGHAASVGPQRTLVLANQPPVVTAGPNLRLLVNEPLAVSGQVTDAGSTTWTGLVDYGDGTPAVPLAVATDGRFALAYAYGLPGIFPITVSVTDDGGAAGQTTVMATVLNQAPYLARLQDQSVQDGQAFRAIALDELLTDPDNDHAEIAWTVSGNAQLAVSLSPTRVLTLTYAPGTVCCERLQFTATDPAGASAVRHAFFAVGAPGADRLPPVAVLTAEPPTVQAGQSARLRARLEDVDGVVSMVRLFGPDGTDVDLDLQGDGSYTASYPTTLPGVLAFEVVAADAQGNLFTDLAEVQVVDPTRAAALTVSLTAPADDATVSGAVAVRGTVQCRELLEYRLETAPVGSSTYTLFASGTDSVFEAELGVFDPTALANGTHLLRLTGTDAAGRSASAQVTIHVDDRRKIGLFTLSFDDKVVSAGGPRLGITRTYDSRDKQTGDFGVGWNLDLNGITVTENRLPCSGWRQSNTGDFWPVYEIVPTLPHYATVMLNQEEILRFEAMPYPDRGVSWPVRYLDVMEYLPVDGATGELDAWPTPYYTSSGIGPLDLWDQEFRLYKPQNFTYTAASGWSYRFERQSPGSLRHRLVSYSDPNGVRTHILPGGLLRDDGQNILFARDAQDRITSVTDPAGAVIHYDYSVRGDLAAVTDESGRVTRFVYDRQHNLLEVFDPAGNRATRNEYDENGRLTAVTDAEGRRLEFSHDPEGRREFVRDRRGGQWVFEYSLDGYVTAVIDPQGNTWRYTYDARGNCLSVLDPEGGLRTWTYDASDNKLSETNPEGQTARWTYDERNHVLSYTDFRGGTETRTYSVYAGDLLSVTDREGHTTSTTYTNFGSPLTETDALGNTTTYTYDLNKRRTSRTDALGRTVSYTYDANGQLIAERQTWSGPAGPVEIVRPYTFSPSGLPESRGDWLGNLTRYEYDPAGRLQAIIDRLGRRLTMAYAPNGRVNARTFPDGSTETYGHDGDGNPLALTDRDGRRTQYEYDGRALPVRIVLPGGGVLRHEYDLTGRRVRTVDPNGNATRLEYDLAGRLEREIDAAGCVTLYAYDPNGNLLSMTDPNGNVTRYAYDLNDRRVRTEYADGGVATVAYDAVGRLATSTDRGGNSTRFEYDAVGNLIKVVDALGQETTAAYDERNALVAVTDAAGHVTRYERDPEGRLLAIVLPLGMRESSTYDAEGNRTSRTTFDGQQITFTYDADNRPVGRSAAGLPLESFAYSPAGRLLSTTDATGLSARTYDAAGRLQTLALPNGEVLTYAYDAAGNLLSLTHPGATVTHAYDAANRLVNAATAPATSVTYTYDAAGNPTTLTFGNGVVSTRTFDRLNRIARIVDRGPGAQTLAAFDYTFTATGFRAGVTESPGDRSVAYDYDPLGRLTEERISTGAGLRTIAYAYDAVGNRTQCADSLAGTLAYTYDANDRLLSAGATAYTYNAAGQRLQAAGAAGTTTYQWDAFGRLRTVAAGARETAYAYDAQGLRVAKSVNGSLSERYLYDSASALPQVLCTTDAAGTPRTAFLYGLGPVAQTSAAGSVALHADATLSTRYLTNAAGAPTDSFDFTAFGIATGASGPSACPLLYAGQWRDPDSGLDYLRARWLDPGSGAFLGRDPLLGSLTAPATRHPYQYALNNPVNAFDPTGQFSMGSLMAGMSASSVLANMAISHMTFAILATRIIREVMGPGFALRYGAMGIISTTGNAEIIGQALDMYQKGNLLIAVASDLISLSNTVLSLTNTFVGLGKAVTGSGLISGARPGLKSAGEAQKASLKALKFGFSKSQSYLIKATNDTSQDLQGEVQGLSTSAWENAIYKYVDACRALIHATDGMPAGGSPEE